LHHLIPTLATDNSPSSFAAFPLVSVIKQPQNSHTHFG